MDESSLFAVHLNHRYSDHIFSDPKMVGIWPNVRLDPWLPFLAR